MSVPTLVFATSVLWLFCLPASLLYLLWATWQDWKTMPKIEPLPAGRRLKYALLVAAVLTAAFCPYVVAAAVILQRGWFAWPHYAAIILLGGAGMTLVWNIDWIYQRAGFAQFTPVPGRRAVVLIAGLQIPLLLSIAGIVNAIIRPAERAGGPAAGLAKPRSS